MLLYYISPTKVYLRIKTNEQFFLMRRSVFLKIFSVLQTEKSAQIIVFNSESKGFFHIVDTA